MKIIYGPKGTGKTKAIIDGALETVKSTKGEVVFITDSNRYAFDLKYPIRFINTSEFEIKGMDGFRGFIKGLVAANADNEQIFIDGIARICEKPLLELQNIFDAMEVLENKFGVNFTLTCSSEKEDLPEFIVKHI